MYFELVGVQQKPQSKDSFDGSTLSACLEASCRISPPKLPIPSLLCSPCNLSSTKNQRGRGSVRATL